ncbi:MAG: hypothetical protein LC112_07795 [Flavobacteriales bacterium]|nr:hypothetical protein [Flavobacteriales bacterium]
MADLDPIELKIVMNSEEVFSEFKKLVEKSVEVDQSAPKIEIETKSIEETAAHLAAVDAQNKAVAASVGAAKSKFDDFVHSMSANNAVLDERAQLTEKSTAALQRHKEIIEYLKDKTTETFDATQIAVYQHQIEQANTAINGIIESANKNVNLMNPAEIEAANKQLRDVQQLLDKISDSTISPSFASPEELDILSNEINKTDDAFQQLGAVIDFVQAKMSGMDSGTEEFKQLEADISAANDMLGRTPQLYDATGNSINQMNDALKTFQEQLAGETDPEAIVILNTNIETLENGIQQVKNAGKTGFDEFGNKIEEQKEKTVQLQTELKNLVDQMAALRLANQENSDEYTILRDRASEVRAAIVSTNREINSEASTTSSFDHLIQAASGITAGFTLAQGASALFGAEQENAEKVIQKVTGAMAVLQSLQEIQVQIKNRDTVATGQQTAAQAAYSLVVGTSTGALKLFRIALAMTGIGLIVILLAALIANWDKVTASIKKSFPALDNFGDKMDTMKSYIMGFLRAYLSLYETVFKTIMKLIDPDFKGALEQVKNTGKNAADSFNAGKADQDNTNLIEKNREKVKKALEDYNRETELIEKRTGKTQYDRRQKAAAAEASLYDKGTKEYKEKMHDRNVVIAEREKEQNDITKKAADKRQKEAEAAGKKAQQLAEKLAADRLKVLEKISEAENNLNNKESEGGEIAAIKKKYDAIRKEAAKVGLGKPDIMRIDIAETKETNLKKYDLETKELLKNINQQKDLYAAYESFKTNIAKTEFAKRNNINLEEFGTFSDMLDDQIAKLTTKAELTAQEAERLKSLKEVKTEADNDKGNKSNQDLDKAVQETMVYEEKILAIKKEYGDRAVQLQKITDENLRTAKLAENELQRQQAVDAANQEAFEKTEIYQRLGESLVGISRRELLQRIEGLKSFLATAKGLTEKEKIKIGVQIDTAEKSLGSTEQATQLNTLLERRNVIQAGLNDTQEKSTEDAEKLKNEWILINQQIKEASKGDLKEFGEWGKVAQQAFGDIADAVGDQNEGLADTLNVMGEIVGAAADIALAIVSGDPKEIVKSIVKGITTIFKLQKAAKESEKKAQEEIKKRQEEQLQAQLDYNATTRQRMINEAKINDLYKSRIDNIKTEAAAQKKALESNLKDQQNLFNKLLGMQTVVGQYTEKYGGFLGIGKKTRVVDVNSSLSSLLGVGAGTQITDDLFKKLEEINAMNPLTGDAKNAYEQLKKLRDEYGSIADAQRELDRMLKDAVTGTTAQSLADSIREGLKSGKKSFADFAKDIEGFLREAIMAGISAKMIEPKIQELQDALFDMMGDGILSTEERAQFQDMYMAIVNQSQEYMDIINQAGIDLTGGNSSVNSLQGALKGMSQESADIISGQFGGMRLAQLETNQILKSSSASMLEKTSQQIAIQMDIEKNTKRTADNTEKLYDVNDNVIKVADGQDKYYKALQAAGIIK